MGICVTFWHNGSSQHTMLSQDFEKKTAISAFKPVCLWNVPNKTQVNCSSNFLFPCHREVCLSALPFLCICSSIYSLLVIISGADPGRGGGSWSRNLVTSVNWEHLISAQSWIITAGMLNIGDITHHWTSAAFRGLYWWIFSNFTFWWLNWLFQFLCHRGLCLSVRDSPAHHLYL